MYNTLNAQSFLGKYILHTPEQTPNAVFLEVSENNTFLYQFKSDVAGKNTIKGTWKQKKRKIYFYPQKELDDTTTLSVKEKMIDTLNVVTLKVVDFTDTTQVIPLVEIILNEKDTVTTNYLGLSYSSYYPEKIQIEAFFFSSSLIHTKANHNFIEIKLNLKPKLLELTLPFNCLIVSDLKLKGKESKGNKIIFVKLKKESRTKK
ncbi:hypothetical protein Fleli_2382 [Bernardetia litoralis DSM 6794]|uniref:Uncharacterized protein n=1 Tax=Bernardetia litoralis (strain ATCC 23117 / DSM 6794 / NBRC 15988 / NCIMB 1366 / Fx l1 / Sio-4) TaxID=880071 RepID=I4ALB7_BERLS|nr:hypothetical protein [Bernardetia litoralis]AFM04752.1 hypothetical protein Fleli_2382 [Bernardetia litoralis DSM 6794]